MNDQNLLEDQPIAWMPTPEVIERAQLTKFMRQVGVSTWQELYEFSIRDVEKFTEEVLKFLDIKFDPPYEKLMDTSEGVEFPNWFGRSADTPLRNEGERNADTPVRNEGGARTTAATFANKKGWHERGYLPHFDGVTTQFVTFRLGDSLPQNVLKEFKQQLENDKLTDNSDEYRDMIEHYLDQGIGSCILRDPRIATIVKDALEHEDGRSCKLTCWVIMPNHVHIVLRPLQGHSMSDILKRVKGVSARRINQLLGNEGSVWQPDYFDRFIRDADHFSKTLNYIRDNPVKAGLCSAPEDWEFSSFSPQAAIADRSVRVPTAGLNITEMCLDRWQTEEMKDRPSVIWEGEDGLEATLSYVQLMSEVTKCSEGLRTKGLGKGDAIGIHMPMIPETVVALLAINRIGGIAVPVFSGYGVEAIVSRMNAVGAKALFTCPNFTRRGKAALSTPVGFDAAGKCPTLKTVFLVPSKLKPPPRPLKPNELSEDSRKLIEAYKAMSDEERAEFQRNQEAESIRQREEVFGHIKELGASEEKINEIRQQMETQSSGTGSLSFGIYDISKTKIERPYRIYLWQKLLSDGSTGFTKNSIEPTSAEDPLIILYTSGTTGKPKGIAHTHASFPIKAAQDMAFGTDVGKGTRISWYTDIGWMMGPWLIYGALINGATICIYDGAPDYPTPDRMWEFVAKHKVEILGISPTLVRALAAHEGSVSSPRVSKGSSGLIDNTESQERLPQSRKAAKEEVWKWPFERHDLSSLRIFASTGEPWNPAPWWWLFEKVGNGKLPIINYSGGTEISGGILMGNPLLPIKPCSFPAPCPGMDVDILDEEGNSVEPGKVGELVIKQPWIGMARGFWQEKERYLDTYWRRFKDIWVHGDFAMRDKDGHWFILGRSDDTLKVAGKRVGPAEVESLLVAHPLVTEAAVIGVPDEVKGTAMVAFVVTGDRLQVTGDERSFDLSPVTRHSSLETELKALVSRDMGKPLAPSRIHFVSALPKTRNAKVMRRVIRSAYLGEDPGDLSALENPKAVEEIVNCRTS